MKNEFALLCMNALAGSTTTTNNALSLCKGVFANMRDDQWKQLRCLPIISQVVADLSHQQKSPFLHCMFATMDAAMVVEKELQTYRESSSILRITTIPKKLLSC
jgi:hypothetical protein